MSLKSPSKQSSRKMIAHTEFERYYTKKGFVVIGIDEVGRGALAGPIGVGAVALNPFEADINFGALEQLKIKDSKLLGADQREKYSRLIKSQPCLSVVSFVDVNMINKKGIVFAFEQAVRSAVVSIQQLLKSSLPVFLLIDAFKVPYVKGVGQKRQLNIVRGDTQCFSIAAASILAKVKRDQYMVDLSKKHQVYKWEANKGYGTQEHIEAIQKYGITSHHRQLFVRNICA